MTEDLAIGDAPPAWIVTVEGTGTNETGAGGSTETGAAIGAALTGTLI